jgi:hypothetical protein
MMTIMVGGAQARTAATGKDILVRTHTRTRSGWKIRHVVVGCAHAHATGGICIPNLDNITTFPIMMIQCFVGVVFDHAGSIQSRMILIFVFP